MATELNLGSFGEIMNIQLRQGQYYGPYRALMKAAGVPVDLTGATIRGSIKRKGLDDTVIVPWKTLILDQTSNRGEYEFWLTVADTTLLAPGEFPELPDSQFVHELELEDSLGRITPLYYGVISVLRSVKND